MNLFSEILTVRWKAIEADFEKPNTKIKGRKKGE